MIEPLGPLLASGRDCDVFEHGPGRVLRRSRWDRSLEREARVIEYARAAGYPAPAVLDLADDGRSMVLERVDGPLMLDVVGRRPWRVAAMGRLLADLHDALHRIDAPDWLAQAPDGGDRLLHFDLHPLNVVMTADGPVVIDWTNAVRGRPMTEVAHTWTLLTTSEIPRSPAAPLLRAGRRLFLDAFLSRYPLDEARPALAYVVEFRIMDPRITDRERARLRRFLAREGSAEDGGKG